MVEPRKDVVERLLREHDEYRHLREQHLDYEKQLETLSGKPFLDYRQQMEVIELKKRKLRVKDRMLEITSELVAS